MNFLYVTLVCLCFASNIFAGKNTTFWDACLSCVDGWFCNTVEVDLLQEALDDKDFAMVDHNIRAAIYKANGDIKATNLFYHVINNSKYVKLLSHLLDEYIEADDRKAILEQVIHANNIDGLQLMLACYIKVSDQDLLTLTLGGKQPVKIAMRAFIYSSISNVNCLVTFLDLNGYECEGMAVHYEAIHGNAPLIKQLLLKGAVVYLRDSQMEMPSTKAYKSGYVDLGESLEITAEDQLTRLRHKNG